ncbi:MAG TPA: hypothetical protein DCY20_06395 [Firmicutes bacterium]|nr:hypothetical protein [Bacillota bacterium]
MDKGEGGSAKGMILSGFIFNGLRQLAISVVFFLLTGLLFGEAMKLTEATWFYYLLYGLLFILEIMAFAFFFRGLDYFYQMRRFLLYPEIKVNSSATKVKTMAEVLEQVKIKELLYTSKKVMITPDYLIVLKDEPSIYSLNAIQAINQNDEIKKKGPAYITLNFYQESTQLSFSNAQEAELFMEVMNQVQKD